MFLFFLRLLNKLVNMNLNLNNKNRTKKYDPLEFFSLLKYILDTFILLSLFFNFLYGSISIKIPLTERHF